MYLCDTSNLVHRYAIIWMEKAISRSHTQMPCSGALCVSMYNMGVQHLQKCGFVGQILGKQKAAITKEDPYEFALKRRITKK